jgi:hypothetical protein
MGMIEVQQKIALPSTNKKGKYATRSEMEYKIDTIQINALDNVLLKLILCKQDIHTLYPNKIIIHAFTLLLSSKDTRLLNIRCQGYVQPIAAGTRGATTRSKAKGKAAEVVYNTIPLPSKILSLILQEWNERMKEKETADRRAAKKLNKGKGRSSFDDDDSDEYEFDSDDSDDDDDDAFVASMIAQSKGGKTSSSGGSVFAPALDEGGIDEKAWEEEKKSGSQKYINLSDLCDLPDEYDECETDAYPESKNDPLNDLDLLSFIYQFIHHLMNHEQNYMIACMEHLDDKDKQILNKIRQTAPEAVKPK